MTKLEKLEKLDTLVLDKMIKYIDENNTEAIKDLANAVTYLKINQIAEDKKNGNNDPVEERKRKLAEIEAKRKNEIKV